jgi:hypothetical protein
MGWPFPDAPGQMHPPCAERITYVMLLQQDEQAHPIVPSGFLDSINWTI